MLMRAIVCFLFFILLADVNCSLDLAGNSSETTNRVAAVISNNGVDGIAPGKSKVYLYSKEYDPVVLQPAKWRDSVLTGSDGKFAFLNLDTGYYNLFCEDTMENKSFTILLIDSKSVKNDTIYDTLRATGSIKGNCTTYSYIDSISLIMCIKGSPYNSPVDSSGLFILNGLPAGDYSIQGIKINLSSVFSPVSTESTKNLKTVTVLPDTTVVFQWQNW
jgi:hypothetical protein